MRSATRTSATAHAGPLRDPPPTRKGRRTRFALLRAARKVFEESGYLDARISDIAETAGVAHGTFYSYFKSKEDIFWEVANEVMEEVLHASHPDTPPDATPVERIRLTNQRFLEAWSEHARFLAVLDQVSGLDERFGYLNRQVRYRFLERAERGIRRWQAAGVVDSGLDPHYTAWALCAMVDNLGRFWGIQGEPLELNRLVDTLTSIWVRSLGLNATDRGHDNVDR